MSHAHPLPCSPHDNVSVPNTATLRGAGAVFVMQCCATPSLQNPSVIEARAKYGSVAIINSIYDVTYSLAFFSFPSSTRLLIGLPGLISREGSFFFHARATSKIALTPPRSVVVYLFFFLGGGNEI